MFRRSLSAAIWTAILVLLAWPSYAGNWRGYLGAGWSYKMDNPDSLLPKGSIGAEGGFYRPYGSNNLVGIMLNTAIDKYDHYFFRSWKWGIPIGLNASWMRFSSPARLGPFFRLELGLSHAIARTGSEWEQLKAGTGWNLLIGGGYALPNSTFLHIHHIFRHHIDKRHPTRPIDNPRKPFIKDYVHLFIHITAGKML